jgi:DNA-directed RNA polymerase specialized sigma subunit
MRLPIKQILKIIFYLSTLLSQKQILSVFNVSRSFLQNIRKKPIEKMKEYIA